MSNTNQHKFIKEIPFGDLSISRTLGSGSYGTVYKAKWGNHVVAVKEFRTQEEIQSFQVELEQLSRVNHDNIVQLFGASKTSDYAYLVMEFADYRSLNHLLHERIQQHYDLKHACHWAHQAAKGVAYLHAMKPKPIMHRDLKPANLLLFSRGKILKICDFGTACYVRTEMTNNTGSAPYMAPEVFATSTYLESGDVYSWGIIFWEILARQHPYPHIPYPYTILWCVKQHGIRPSELEDCSEPIWTLITRAWHRDPGQRPKMNEIVKKMKFIYDLCKDRKDNRIDIESTIDSHNVHQPNCNQSDPNIPQVRAQQAKTELARRLIHRQRELKSRFKSLEAERTRSNSSVDAFDEIKETKSLNASKRAYYDYIKSKYPRSESLGRPRNYLLEYP